MDADKAQRALIITPSFFGYERDIVAEFERQGWSTTLLDERPSNAAAVRALLRLRRGIADRWVNRYFREWQANLIDEPLDLVLVVKAEVVPRWFLEGLRLANPQARFVFYTYDALSNAPHCLEVLHCFDQRLSFDRSDVETRPDLDYLPLFYTSDFEAAEPDVARASRHRLAFVGTLHTKRYRFARRCVDGREDAFAFFYVPAAWYFAFVKYFTREHSDVPWSDVSFKPMTRSQIAQVFSDSHAVLDMQREGQHGLTMRTFEVLASGAILVTTNAAVRAEPFYDPDRIVVVPSDPAEIDAPALHAQLAARARPVGPPENFGDYSLASWVRQIAAPSSTHRLLP